MKKNCMHKCTAHSVCDQCCTYIEGLSVSYNGTRAVDDINFRFSCGELTAVIGPNGGGKSSLLRAILGEVKYSGSIGFCSTTRNGRKPLIGYMPQKVSIQPDSPVSVIDLLLLSQGSLPAWMHISAKKRKEMTDLLSIVSAGNLADRKIGELSGGELQRVLLACSLNPLPDLLLLDEPVAAVDVRGMEMFYEIICNLRKMFHMSIVLVTHDIGAVAPHADKMVLLNRKILVIDSPMNVLKHPEFGKQMGSVFPLFTKSLKDNHLYGVLR